MAPLATSSNDCEVSAKNYKTNRMSYSTSTLPVTSFRHRREFPLRSSEGNRSRFHTVRTLPIVAGLVAQ